MPTIMKWIDVGDGNLNFFFTRIYHYDRVQYFVSVIDKERSHFRFNMKQVEGNIWIIMEPWRMPDWIVKLEETLSNVICHEIE